MKTVMTISLFIFIACTNIFSMEEKSNNKATKLSKENKEELKWKKVNTLLTKEIKTIKSLGRLGPRLQYRLLELYSERIKLIRIKENKDFLKADLMLLKTKGKKYFFRKSQKQYNNTEKFGLSIVKKFPHFINNSDIYYTLAINSRDYSSANKTEQYLKLALKNSEKGSPVVHLIKTSLAEYYYNEKKYSSAIRNYRFVLKNNDDEWKSKHEFNNAWCLFKVKNHNEAISGIRRAFNLSKSKRYIDVKDQVFDTVGVFYVHANRIEEGVDFYLKEHSSPTDHLIKMAKRTSTQLGLTKAEYVFNNALKNSQSKKNYNDEMKISLAQLKLYRSFKQEQKYFKVAKNINKLYKVTKIDDEHLNEAIEEIKSKVGFLQVKFSKLVHEAYKEDVTRELNKIINYFNILKSIHPIKKDEYTYYKGETYFAAKNYNKASKNYAIALKHSYKKSKNEELQRKIINSLLALLDKANFPKKKKYKLTSFTYKNHLKIWPIDSISQKIYPKYFNLLMNNNRPKKAYTVLLSYIKNYPKDTKIQQPLFTKLFDNDVKNKDKKQVTAWINKMQKGFLDFDDKFIKKSILILGQLLFEELNKLKLKGDTQKVLLGYTTIFKNKTYPKKIKAEAALELSNLYVNKGDIKSSFTWLKKSIKNYNINEFLAQKDFYNDIAKFYIIFQEFQKASTVNEYIVNRECKKTKKLTIQNFRQTIQYRLIEAQPRLALKKFKRYAHCISDKNKLTPIKEEIVSFLFKNNKAKTLKSLLKQTLWADQRSSISMKLSEYNKAQTELLSSREQRLEMKRMYKSLRLVELPSQKPFDDKKLNQSIENNFSVLKGFESYIDAYLKSSNPSVSLKAHGHLANAYKRVASLIKNYDPKGFPKKFKKELKAQLNPLAVNVSAQAENLIKNSISDLEKKKYLSRANFYITMDQKLQTEMNFRYPASKLSSAVDFPGGL